MSSQKIVVFGGIVQDLISYTERFPRPGESVRGNAFHAGAGGKGANQAVAAAKLGAQVTMIATVGQDSFGEQNILSLKSNGVDVSQIMKTDKAATATATITVNGQGENCIVMNLGANLEMSPEVAEQKESVIASAGIFVGQAEVAELGNRRAFELAKKHGVRTFFNAAPGDPDMDKSILKFVDIICTNENEAEFITGIAQNNVEDAKAAVTKMLTMGPEIVLVTLGSKGCVLATKEGIEHLQCGKVSAIDTTGAGDCFVGSFVALLMRGFSVKTATQTAIDVASLSVTRKGTQTSYWSLEEIKNSQPNLLPEGF